MADLPITTTADGVRIAVRLNVRAGADRLDVIARAIDDAPVLKVAVRAPPAEGRANEALLRLLAKEWRLSRRALAIIGGPKSRNKVVEVAGDPAELLRHIGSVLAALPRE